MTQPVRILLSRRAGFNLQAASVARNGLPAQSVSRPGPWGNPFIVWRDDGGHWIVTEPRDGKPVIRHKPATDDVRAARRYAVTLYREWLDGKRPRAGTPPTRTEIIAALRGKNLACWCPYKGFCHADVLIEVANGMVCEAVEAA